MGAKRRDRGEDVDVRRSSSSSASKSARYENSDRQRSRNPKHSTRQDFQDRRSEKRPVARAVREEVRPVREPAAEEKIIVVDKDPTAEDCASEGKGFPAEASTAQTEGTSAQQLHERENEPEEGSADKNQDVAGENEDAEKNQDGAGEKEEDVDADETKDLVPEASEAAEAAIAEEDLEEQGVPHTPEVQDVKLSSPCAKCRIVDEFEKLGRLGEGAYGVVYKARDKRSEEIVALKKIKMHNETEGFPVTSLREINLLISLRHPSIVDVREVVIGKDLDSVFMVMEYIENSLQARLKQQPFEHGQVKHMMLQLLDAVAYLHDNWVLHRDLKPSNILLTGKGELKICDFGLARRYDSPIKVYTHNVVTRWYRAPELLTSKEEDLYKYTTAIDVWSLGCIMAELIIDEPLFPGQSEIDQLRKIQKLVLAPKKLDKPGFIFPSHKLSSLRDRILYPAAQEGKPMLSEKGLDLLARLLTYDPDKRITAKQALSHPWFEELPLPTPEGICSSPLSS